MHLVWSAGKSKGCGILQFDTPERAEQVIEEMSGSLLGEWMGGREGGSMHRACIS